MCSGFFRKAGENVEENNITPDNMINTDEDGVSTQISYLPFSGEDALEVILPVEESVLSEIPCEAAEKQTVKVKKEKKKLSLSPDVFKKILPAAVDLIFLTGDVTIGIFKRLFAIILPVILSPLKFTAKKLLSVFRKIRRAVKKGPSSFINTIKASAVERAADKSKDGKQAKPSYIGAFFSFILSENRLLRSAFNLAFPIVIILAVYNIFSLQSGRVFALQVFYNGQSIGYVESKEIYDQAKHRAEALLGTAEEGGASLLSAPVYKVTRVAVNELSNPSMISDGIIACSDTDYVSACGIYIDGKFLCAVRNESDAVAVFDRILEPYRKKLDKNSSVGFVEEIEYVSGLYPRDSELLWDSSALLEALSSPKAQAVYHTLAEGESLKTIYAKYGISYNQLVALNPDVDFTKPEEITKLLVSRQENYVRVKLMKTRTKKQSVPFETVERNTSSLSKGTKKTSQEGVNGINQITELVTYIDGVESYSTVIATKTVKKPVNKVVLIGTATYGGSPSSSSGSSYGWTWPTRGAYHISSYYGYRSYSISGWSSWHSGIDIVIGGKGSTGVPVVAAASGTVERVDRGYRGYGHMVLINHGNGVKTRYAHMQSGSITVYPGQRVSKGQQIGRIGSTGNSTGPHLHFEVIVNGSTTNPLKYVKN